jgi:hypothetical protein
MPAVMLAEGLWWQFADPQGRCRRRQVAFNVGNITPWTRAVYGPMSRTSGVLALFKCLEFCQANQADISFCFAKNTWAVLC